MVINCSCPQFAWAIIDAVSTVITAVGGLAITLVAFVMLRAAPRLTVVLWLLVLFFVPVWVGVSIGPFWSAITLMTILAIATCSTSIRLSPVDGLIAGFGAIIVMEYALGLISLSAAVIALSEWLIPYSWGRLILTRVRLEFIIRAVATMAVVAAALALVEAVTSTNFFVLIPPGSQSDYEIWSTLQIRAGLTRVEGAFGHSIALGATLSMCAAFVLATRRRLVVRLALLLIITSAIALTLSRIGLVTLVITVALSIVVLPQLSRLARVIISLVGLTAALVVVPFISRVLLTAGQEAGGSADYRFDLLMLGQVLRPFGAAKDITGLTMNGEYLGVFARSIDNALLVVALRVGWVPTILVTISIILAMIFIFKRGRANVANIAVAGQLPGLLTVAFITQYSTFFWFVVGLAVALNVESSDANSTFRPVSTTDLPGGERDIIEYFAVDKLNPPLNETIGKAQGGSM